MKVKDLIKLLELQDPNDLVVMASDSEGNNFSPASEVEPMLYRADTEWSGEITDDEDVIPAIILWPKN